LVLTAGFLVGMMIRETVAKGFTYCLPGQRTTVRRMAFLIGFVLVTVATLTFPGQGGVRAWHSVSLFGSVFGANLVTYSAALEAGFVTRGGGTLMMRLPVLAWAFIVASLFLGDYLRLESLVMGHPVLTVLGGLAVSIGVWLQMGCPGWARQVRVSGWMFSPSFQREGYARLSRRLGQTQRVESAAESFFLNRMTGARDYGRGRFIWGTLYTTLGRLAPWWKWLTFGLIVVGIIAGVTVDGHQAGRIPVLAYLSYMTVPQSWPSLRSPILVPAGRRERLWATISFVGATAAILSLLIAVLAAISVPLSWLIPEVEVRGVPLAFHQIPVQSVWMPLFVVPLVTAVRVPFRKRWLPIDLFVVMTIPILVPMILVLVAWIAPLASFDLLSSASLPHRWLTMTIVFIWALSLVVCRNVARSRPLIGP
jgi:hypothetical protein